MQSLLDLSQKVEQKPQAFPTYLPFLNCLVHPYTVLPKNKVSDMWEDHWPWVSASLVFSASWTVKSVHCLSPLADLSPNSPCVILEKGVCSSELSWLVVTLTSSVKPLELRKGRHWEWGQNKRKSACILLFWILNRIDVKRRIAFFELPPKHGNFQGGKLSLSIVVISQ